MGAGKEERKGSGLVVVESVQKARTIGSMLGKDYEVVASKGHICDLPEKGNKKNNEEVVPGIKMVDGKFVPVFETLKGRATVIKRIKKLAEAHGCVYVATDPDREGEAIAHHIFQFLPGSVEKKRVEFREIVPKAVREGLENARGINAHLVEAQFARRMLDRIVGYLLSPFLWETLGPMLRIWGLSAGRVQTVALRFVVEREEEIEKFRKSVHWTVGIKVETPEGEFLAKAHDEQGKLLKFSSPEEARKAVEEWGLACGELAEEKEGRLVGKTSVVLRVSDVESKEIKEKNFPPFTTPALQSEAYKRFKFSPSRTMRLAQELYEGMDVKLPDGKVVRKGLITYMRTDSVRTNYSARAKARELVGELFGEEYVPPKVLNYQNKKKNVQDAHEAIRPTSVELTPEILREGGISEDHVKLYELIWRRFLASQTKPAVKEKTKVVLTSPDLKGVRFQAEGWKYLFKGAKEVYGALERENSLPPLKVSTELTGRMLVFERHETKPPARYNFRTIIEKLEKEGIGRPSTYAPTVDLLLRRHYVVVENGVLRPTVIGRMIVFFLKKHFPELVDYEFTSKMEERLDEIEMGMTDRNGVLREYYELVTNRLKRLSEEAEKNGKKKWYDELRDYLATIPEAQKECPTCGGKMVPRLSLKTKNGGKFLYFYLSCAKEGCNTFHMVEAVQLSGTRRRWGGKKK